MGLVAGNCTGKTEGTSLFGRGGGNILGESDSTILKFSFKSSFNFLGRAQNIRVIIAESVFTASFYIIEGQPMDICWGNDLIHEHGCQIDFGKDILKIGGKTVPILEGDELPQNIEILQQHGPIDVNTGKLAK